MACRPLGFPTMLGWKHMVRIGVRWSGRKPTGMVQARIHATAQQLNKFPVKWQATIRCGVTTARSAGSKEQGARTDPSRRPTPEPPFSDAAKARMGRGSSSPRSEALSKMV